MPKKKLIYLDYASTTPVSAEVLKVMRPYFSDVFGNSESVHSFGRSAQGAVDISRETISNALGAGFREIVFTASATEANNMAIHGIISRFLDKNGASCIKQNIIISSIEHSSVYATSASFNGVCEVRLARPDSRGVVTPESVKKLMDENTIFVSVMHGNNETGVIQPIKEIGAVIKEFRGSKAFPLFHVDAAQSFGYIALKPHECGVDLATISSHKIYGPKGVGVLFVSEGSPAIPAHAGEAGVKINSLIIGGDHERGLRAGTLNVPAIVGFAEAVKETEKNRKAKAKKVGELKKYFFSSLKRNIKNVEMNSETENSLPHILNIYFPGVRAEELVIGLDMAGIAISSGSACASRAQTSSRTVREVFNSEERARESVRISFSYDTKKSDIDYALKAFLTTLKSMRN